MKLFQSRTETYTVRISAEELSDVKRIVLILIILATLLGLYMIFGTRGHRYDEFDPEKEGIVDVIVHVDSSVMSNRKEKEIRYYSLASNGRICLTAAFEPDTATTYTVPYGCFKSYADRNKILNRLDHMALEDKNRNQVPVSETQAKIFQRIAELEHSIINIRFIETGGQTFVYLELNVNLWTPCCLYWYDCEADALVLLHEWDAEEVIGLHLRNITLARYPEQ